MPDTPVHPGPPTRATVSATLRFGMVTVPVKLYTATEDTALIERHQYVKGTDDHQVGQKTYDKATEAEVNSDEIVKKVDVGDKKVELTDDEIVTVTAAYGVDRGGVEVICLVPADALTSRYVVSKLYQVRPESKNVEQPFTLLMAVLASENVGALVRIPIKGSPRYGVLTGDGQLHMLLFDDEVREARPMPEAKHTDRDLDMARALVLSLGVDTPALLNESRTALLEYLEQKAAGQTPEIAVPDAPAPVADLTAALEASLAAAQIAVPKAA